MLVIKIKHIESKENWVTENNAVPTEDFLYT